MTTATPAVHDTVSDLLYTVQYNVRDRLRW